MKNINRDAGMTLSLLRHGHISQELKERSDRLSQVATDYLENILDLPTSEEQLSALNMLVDHANNFSFLRFKVYQAMATRYSQEFHSSEKPIDSDVRYRLWTMTHMQPFFDDNEIPYLGSEDVNAHHFDFVISHRRHLIDMWQKGKYPYPIQPTLDLQ